MEEFVGIRLTKQLRSELQKLADADRRKLSDYIRVFLERFVEDAKKNKQEAYVEELIPHSAFTILKKEKIESKKPPVERKFKIGERVRFSQRWIQGRQKIQKHGTIIGYSRDNTCSFVKFDNLKSKQSFSNNFLEPIPDNWVAEEVTEVLKQVLPSAVMAFPIDKRKKYSREKIEKIPELKWDKMIPKAKQEIIIQEQSPQSTGNPLLDAEQEMIRRYEELENKKSPLF